MFEVGKTYKCTNGLIAKCLFPYRRDNLSGMIGEVVKDIPGWIVGEQYHFSGSAWSEVKEPRKLKRWIRIIEKRDGSIFLGNGHETETSARHARLSFGWKLIDVVPFEYVEKI